MVTPLPLPPLEQFRAFEAAARLGSFQAAARAIHLTPSAISHRIRSLETFYGVALFVRGHRRVELTEAGRALQASVARAFLELQRGAAALRQARDPSILKVTAAPAFANAFLTRRIQAFESATPGLELQLEASATVVDLEASGADVAVRLSAERPADVDAERILPLVAGPVCTPALATVLRREGWPGVTRLRLRLDPKGWDAWFARAGVDGAPGRELWCDSLNDAMQAALEGAGVALAPLALATPHLRTGRLEAPCAETVRSKLSYWLVSRHGEARTGKVARFRRWLKAELAEAEAPA